MLVIDAAIKGKHPTKKYFPEQAETLLTVAHQPLTVQQLRDCNQRFISDFNGMVADLLERNFKLPHHGSLTDLLSEVLLATGSVTEPRMTSRHLHVFWQRFDDIQQALFNILFGAIDYLY